MKVVLDACVLYPTVMREMLLGCADAGLYQPQWSGRILEEWARAAARQGAVSEAVARGEIALLRSRWSDAVVPVDAPLEMQLYLPDANDVHVLASAIGAGCELIVTMNLKDFPNRILAEHGLRAVHPDMFFLGLLNGAPDDVFKIAVSVRANTEQLSGQSWGLRGLMKKARLPRFGKALERLEN